MNKLLIVGLLSLSACASSFIVPNADGEVLFNPITNELPAGNWLCQPIPGAVIQRCIELSK